jgi:hypothetical protein
MTIDSGGRTSDDYSIVAVFVPSGLRRTASVLKGREMDVQKAIDGLEAGQMVWVAPADARQIEDWLAGGPR